MPIRSWRLVTRRLWFASSKSMRQIQGIIGFEIGTYLSCTKGIIILKYLNCIFNLKTLNVHIPSWRETPQICSGPSCRFSQISKRKFKTNDVSKCNDSQHIKMARKCSCFERAKFRGPVLGCIEVGF